MPATDSFVSSALGVSSTTATLTANSYLTAFSEYTPLGFFVKKTALGVTVTKASSFGGGQSDLTFPITRDGAIELANSLLRCAN